MLGETLRDALDEKLGTVLGDGEEDAVGDAVDVDDMLPLALVESGA